MRPVLRRWTSVAAAALVVAFTAPPASAASATADAKRLVTALNRAFAHGDIAYLVGHLHPAVIGRYGTTQCRSYLATLVRQPPKIRATAYAAPAPYAYTSDGVSTTVANVVAVTATVTIGGRANPTTVHVTRTQWFTDCGSPVGAAAALATANTLVGHYAGTWHNTTFGTSGSVTLDIAVDAAAPALHVTVALGGNVFGAAAPPPETLTVPLDGAHPKGPVTVTSPFFGPITATMQDDGSIVVDAPSVPGGVIAKMHQTLTKTATGFTGNYTLAFAGSTNTASGTIDVTRS